MQTSMLLGAFDWLADFFRALIDMIPKIMYLLYASAACILDVLQLFFRKLAGLDVYYVDGKPVAGDLVTNFITGILRINAEGSTYSALSTVFWAMIVFGVIMCFACTIVAIIKSHYSYDDKSAKGPMQYVYTAGKAIINMVAVPIIVVLGLFVSEAILTALDTITSVSSGTVVSMYGTENVNTYLKSATTRGGDKTYVQYDIFGFNAGIAYGKSVSDLFMSEDSQLALTASKNQTFSGSLFKTAAYNANRARLGQMRASQGNFAGGCNDVNDMKLFSLASTDSQQDLLADMIDTAFACGLKLKQTYDLDYSIEALGSTAYFTNYLTTKFHTFSKFNIGLVWYYYDLWQFNFIVGFAGVIVCVSIFINIILGLMTRLFMCIALFLVAPPLFGLAPLDGGEAGKSWRKNFMQQVLMAYGAVLGMNIMFLILPYINEISFFNIGIADYFAQTLVIIVGLITIKSLISVMSGLVGGADANKTGADISKEVGSVAGKATKMTYDAAKIGVGGVKTIGTHTVGAMKDLAVGGAHALSALGHTGVAFGEKVASAVNKGRSKSARKSADKAADLAVALDTNSFDEGVLNSANDALKQNAGRRGLKEAERILKDAGHNAGDAKLLARAMRKQGKNHVTNADLVNDVFDMGIEKENKSNSLLATSTVQAAMVGASMYNAGAQMKKSGSSMLKSGKHVIRAGFGAALTATEGVKFVGGSLDKSAKGNDMYKEFKENSFWKSPDHAADTAKNTADMLKILEAQHATQQPQAQSPEEIKEKEPTFKDKVKK